MRRLGFWCLSWTWQTTQASQLPLLHSQLITLAAIFQKTWVSVWDFSLLKSLLEMHKHFTRAPGCADLGNGDTCSAVHRLMPGECRSARELECQASVLFQRPSRIAILAAKQAVTCTVVVLSCCGKGSRAGALLMARTGASPVIFPQVASPRWTSNDLYVPTAT